MSQQRTEPGCSPFWKNESLEPMVSGDGVPVRPFRLPLDAQGSSRWQVTLAAVAGRTGPGTGQEPSKNLLSTTFDRRDVPLSKALQLM
jgi:hypothetical protein